MVKCQSVKCQSVKVAQCQSGTVTQCHSTEADQGPGDVMSSGPVNARPGTGRRTEAGSIGRSAAGPAAARPGGSPGRVGTSLGTAGPLPRSGRGRGELTAVGALGVVAEGTGGNGADLATGSPDETRELGARHRSELSELQPVGANAMAVKKGKSVGDAQNDVCRRLNVKVTEEAYERILLHAIKAKRSPGDLVTDLITNHLREWKISPNTTPQLVKRNRPDSTEHERDSAAA